MHVDNCEHVTQAVSWCLRCCPSFYHHTTKAHTWEGEARDNETLLMMWGNKKTWSPWESHSLAMPTLHPSIHQPKCMTQLHRRRRRRRWCCTVLLMMVIIPLLHSWMGPILYRDFGAGEKFACYQAAKVSLPSTTNPKSLWLHYRTTIGCRVFNHSCLSPITPMFSLSISKNAIIFLWLPMRMIS